MYLDIPFFPWGFPSTSPTNKKHIRAQLPRWPRLSCNFLALQGPKCSTGFWKDLYTKPQKKTFHTVDGSNQKSGIKSPVEVGNEYPIIYDGF